MLKNNYINTAYMQNPKYVPKSLSASDKKKQIKSTAKGPGLGTFKPMNLIARKK